MEKPLSGIKVIEIADHVSGPVCGRILADMGAEVIKIERSTGNAWRKTAKASCAWKFTDKENPGYDLNNTGKKHIVLNLKTPEGLTICHKLLESADVFLTNNRIQALKRLELDYDSIKERYPSLIYAIILGYGEKGQDANSPAFDHTAFWAKTGFLLDMAPLSKDYFPVFPPSSVGDNFTGMTLVSEICAALFNRTKTGRGDYVRSSLYHNGIFALGAMQVAAQGEDGTVYPKTRPQHGAAHGDFQCKDGRYVYVVSGHGEELYAAAYPCASQKLFEDPRFATPASKRENAEALYSIMKETMLQKTADEWLAFAKKADIPMVKMLHFREVSEDDQALTNGYIQSVSYPSGVKYKIASSPIEMDSVGQLTTQPSHGIGEDTEEVLREYGCSEKDIIILREKQVIN